MTYSQAQIGGLAERRVRMSFKDGCCMDLLIVETLHLEEGGDFVAEVLSTPCTRANHRHFRDGEFINIHVNEIESIEALET